MIEIEKPTISKEIGEDGRCFFRAADRAVFTGKIFDMRGGVIDPEGNGFQIKIRHIFTYKGVAVKWYPVHGFLTYKKRLVSKENRRKTAEPISAVSLLFKHGRQYVSESCPDHY